MRRKRGGATESWLMTTMSEDVAAAMARLAPDIPWPPATPEPCACVPAESGVTRIHTAPENCEWAAREEAYFA